MATKKDFLDEQDPNNQSTSLEASAAGGGPTGAGGVQAKPQGSGWTNLQTYLDANAGQGGQLANAVTKTTQDRVNTADSNAKLWEDAAKTRVDQNTRKEGVDGQDAWSNVIRNGSADKVAGIDQNAFNGWKQLSNYWGDKTAEADKGYGDVYGQTQQAKQDIQGAQSYDGQKVLADKAFNQNGRYTRGMGTLDTFLMRGDQAGQQALQGFQDRNKDFGSNLTKATGNVNAYIGGADQRGQQAYNNVLQAIADRRNSIQTDAQGRLPTLVDQANTAATQQVLDRYKGTGFKPSTGVPVSRAEDVNWTDALGDPDLAALNTLAGIDDDQNTNALSRANRPLVNIDWRRVDADIQRQQQSAQDQYDKQHPGTITIGGQEIPIPVDTRPTDTGGSKSSDEIAKEMGGIPIINPVDNMPPPTESSRITEATTQRTDNTPTIVRQPTILDEIFKPNGAVFDSLGNEMRPGEKTIDQQVTEMHGIPLIPQAGSYDTYVPPQPPPAPAPKKIIPNDNENKKIKAKTQRRVK